MTTPAPGTPTQVAHPWRAVLRTLVAAGVGVVVAWVARTLGVDLADLTPEIVDSITGFVWAIATGVVQWLLTRPAVESWLRRYAPGLATGVHREAPRTADGAHVVTALNQVDVSSLEQLRDTLVDIGEHDPAIGALDKVLNART